MLLAVHVPRAWESTGPPSVPRAATLTLSHTICSVPVPLLEHYCFFVFFFSFWRLVGPPCRYKDKQTATRANTELILLSVCLVCICAFAYRKSVFGGLFGFFFWEIGEGGALRFLFLPPFPLVSDNKLNFPPASLVSAGMMQQKGRRRGCWMMRLCLLGFKPESFFTRPGECVVGLGG